MGSKTIDLEIAVLHKTIKTPQQYFHTESLLAAIAKAAPSSARTGRRRDGGRAGSPNSPGRKGERDRRQLWGAPRSSSGRRGQGRSRRGPQAERWECRRGARRGGGRGAPGRRAGPGSNRRLPCGSSVPGAGRQGGRVAGTQRRRQRLGAGSGRCVPSGAASHYRSRGAGSGPSARAPRRRAAMSRGAERRAVSWGAREPPQASRLLARGAGRRGSVPGAGAGRARAFVCVEGAGTRSALGSSMPPAPPSPPSRVRSGGVLSERYKRGAPPRAAQPIGPPCGSRVLVGRQARPSSAPVRHWAPGGGAPADR